MFYSCGLLLFRRRRRRGGRAARECMALLYRATRLKDRADNHVFTFGITRSATRESDRDVTSLLSLHSVSLTGLNSKFADAKGEFQLELTMSRVRTLYFCELRAPLLDTLIKKSYRGAFAGFDWSVSATDDVG